MVKVISVANPAAGAEISVAVPAGEFWRILAIHFKLVASGTAGNRLVRLFFDDGATVLFKVPNDVNHVASQTTEYSYGLAATFEAAQGATVVARTYPIPEIILKGGCRIGTLTAAISATDQFSEIRILVGA